VIDWFTVIAQIVNFLVLVALLKYFLYGRVMDAIDDRESELASRHHQAEQNLEESRTELESAREKNLQLDAQREKLLAAVRTEVGEFRKQQMNSVRNEIAGIQSRWSESIEAEQCVFLQELSQRAAESVCTIARQALSDLAGVSLESRIVSRFMDMVMALGPEERRVLIESLTGTNQCATIQTTHELPDKLQSSLVSHLEQQLDVKLAVTFETRDELECGIALLTNSRKLSWNLRDYLTELENDLRTMLEEKTTNKSSRAKEGAVEQV
jgi:F-type H+-transporting ATPase subunit b